MYLCKNLRWKSLLIVSLMNRFGVFVSPRAWFLNTTSSSHLLLTLKEPGWLILIKGFPRISSASFILASSSAYGKTFLSFSSALSFLILSSSAIRASVSSSSSSSSSLNTVCHSMCKEQPNIVKQKCNKQ
ncbi:uncharacterized protein LOC110430948 [Sorghum bicolor]|uniref:uncharacterized protein LOC110430948 n=1 Tax=Sorghum bicolor TaxID=4558 RepID=UPI000B4246BA|nr:uncharacterized protein LOC110430948 [Sorghum bicolor]|eukprot:XP_021304885.1 uncharacterized protein LOC110430948 [Sorghum bicolor]